MDKVRLIYNPKAGDTTFKNHLDIIFDKFQGAGYQVVPFRSARVGDMIEGLENLDSSYSSILVAGGDGSVNEVINGMIKNKIDLPLGIFPAGTANDFAHHINMPDSVELCCDVFLRKNIRKVDIGVANDRYFINVASGGLLTNVSQNIDIKLKNTLGKLAYYIKGIEQLPSFRPFKMAFAYEDQYIEEDIYLFLVLNGNSAGGFEKIAKDACMSDGKFDVLAIKACQLPQMASLFIKILKGEHFNDPNIIYFKTDALKIMELEEFFLETDLDGERGPEFPLDIKLIPRRLQVFCNR